MKSSLLSFLFAAVLIGCGQPNKQTNDTVESFVDTIPRITGIGGIFFFSDNPAETKAWYNKNLGLEVDEYGAVFEFRNSNNPNQINYLRWGIIENGSTYLNPSEKDFMVNYRVQNIEGLVHKLKKNGVNILNDIETYSYGKFVHILDLDGNKVELWEPVDSVLTAIGGKTNK